MKKRTRKWISVFLSVTVFLAIIPPAAVFAEGTAAQSETPFLAISSLPDNLRYLLNDAISELSADGKNRSADSSAQSESQQLQVLNTDDLNSIQIEDGNGNGRAIVLGVPIRYTDEDGNVRFIDTSMTETDFLNSVFTEYDYQNTAGDTLFRFSKKPDKGIRVDKSFTYAIYNSDKRKLSKGYADQTIDGNGRMVYPEAFGKDTYVEYINTNTGIKENIVLEKNVGQNRFEFVFESKEYVPILSEDQTVICVVHRDDPEDVKYCFSSLYVYDSFQPQEYDTIEAQPSQVPVYVGSAAGTPQSSTVEQSVAQETKHFTTDNYYEVAQLSKGKYKITSVVSAEFLNDPNTVYPVVVDPGISSVSRDNNAQDTFVWENDSDNAGNGSLDYLRFGMKNGGRIHAYHRFTQLPNIGSSPYYVNITDATLKVTFRSGQTSGANGVCMIVTDHQWSESSLTWNNQPYGEWGYVSSHNNYQYYNFYVRPFVEMWYYGGYPNYGVDFTYDTMIEDYNSVVSSEGEVARAPQLSITYSTVPTITDDICMDGSLILGDYEWYKFTPAVTGKYSFTSIGAVDTYGELYQGATKLSTNDDSGPELNFQILYDLNAGSTYYIKVRGYNIEKIGDYQMLISKDPFQPVNIEYIRIKKYDMSDYGGDSDITTMVTKSYLQSERYFECSAPGRSEVAFVINSELINGLQRQESAYQNYPTMYLPNFYFHLAKLGVDNMAQDGIISSGSDEYYGIWASEANRLLALANSISDQIQLTCAIITTCYSLYNIVSSIKAVQASYNTTVNVSNATYMSTYNSVRADYLQGGTGYNSFEAAKKALGPAGTDKAWHHIVEQNQISNSNFSATNIHNTKNLVSIESGFSGSIHSKISGHYTSIQSYTGGLSVRQWLSGKSFQYQFEYGLEQLAQYGTIRATSTGWIFTPY